MTPIRSAARFALVLCWIPLSGIRAEERADRIHSLITAPEYKGGRWGILAVDLETKQPVYALNPDMLFAPASVTKLYSCAAAMLAVGPNQRYETPVYRRGGVDNGVLTGDLILVAQGDLTLGGRTLPDGKLAFKDHDHIYAGYLSTQTELTETDPLAGLNDLARQVKAAGVTAVSGDVLIDDRLFQRERGSGSGPSLVTPIMVNDNIVDVTVTPGSKAGAPATIKVRPETALYRVESKVETVAAEKVARVRLEVPQPGTIRVLGEISANMKPVVRIYSVEDPARFARGLFIEALRRTGIEVRADLNKMPTATLPERDAYAGLPRIAGLESAPLSELVKVTLKVSHNPYASTLPMLIAVKNGKRTLADGMKLQHDALEKLGLDVASISLESGAGGGNADRVTPRATVQLLTLLAARPDFPTFQACLPVLGLDGTLTDVVSKKSPARGNVFAKTGTYTDSDLLNQRLYLRSKSLAGVMTTANGRKLAFAVFVNDVPLAKGVEPAREGNMIGRICEVFYQDGR
jgi:D-alanyl-D-alanine carboxypeptidase/D-alanyl-D-alanine-endopeptidase (penicillin-binding protein 4)